jgi:aldose 1-epimerase
MKKIVLYSSLSILMSGIFTFCSNKITSNTMSTTNATSSAKGIHQADWGEADGKKVYLYTLTNAKGVQVKISNYGGTITSWITPDNKGNNSSIVLGFDELQGYLAKPPYFGATIGRYGNRIANGKFSLDGNNYQLATNDGKNHLHGGNKGFDKVVWDANLLIKDQPSLTLNYLSKDGEEGYPGNLKVTVNFSLSDDNELTINYTAKTDKATPVNLTNHSYFNLTGDMSKNILDHSLMIDASRYTPVDATLIPTGELKAVQGTPFDFIKATTVGSRIAQVPGGYDHNWVLNKKGKSIDLVATLSDPQSGRTLQVYTAEPGIQFYSGNFLDGTIKTSNGTPITKHSAMCLETQHFPDSPNQPAFPTTTLKPGEKYATTTKYKVLLNK